jgi:hypothetical protein
MTYEAFDPIELGQAEALIEAGIGADEEIDQKFGPVTAPYVEFECTAV